MNNSDYMDLIRSATKAQEELDDLRVKILLAGEKSGIKLHQDEEDTQESTPWSSSKTDTGVTKKQLIDSSSVKKHQGGAKGSHRSVVIIDPEGNHRVFKNVQDAADHIGISRSRLSHLLNAHVINYKEYKVSFLDDNKVTLP